MRRNQARWYGLIVGVLTGLGLVIFAMMQLYFLRPSAGLRDVPLRNAVRALLAVATSFLGFIVPTCAVNGYLGGLAIDQRWSAKAWSGIAIGLLIAAAVEAVSFALASSFETHALTTAALVEPDSMLSLTAEVVVANLGWAMGIWVRPDADAMLRGAPSAATARDSEIGNLRLGRYLGRRDARPGIADIAGHHRSWQSCDCATAGTDPLTITHRQRGYGLSATAWYVDTARLFAAAVVGQVLGNWRRRFGERRIAH